jgi:hypothetical protein
VCGSFWGLKQFKMAAVAMVNKVQKMLNSHFEKINLYQHNFTWHMIFLQSFIKFDQGISEKSGEQNVWKNNNNN